MPPPTAIPQRSMAEWLDHPVRWLRWNAHTLRPMMWLAVALVLFPAVLGQLLTGLSPSPGGLSLAEAPLWMVLTVLSATVTYGCTALLQLTLYVSMAAVDQGRVLTVRSILQDALRWPMVSTLLAGLAIQLAMVVLGVLTCGMGLLAWLVLALYLPLAFPIAAREGVGGFQAHLRSISLVHWSPPSGPWYGSADRVIVGLHVIGGIGYALLAIPNVPAAAWVVSNLDAMFGMTSLDPVALLEVVTPPIWLALPIQLTAGTLGLVAKFYSHRLFLDLHTDLLNAREGRDLEQALDRLQDPPTHI